jgi:hypothetical protein
MSLFVKRIQPAEGVLKLKRVVAGEGAQGV